MRYFRFPPVEISTEYIPVFTSLFNQKSQIQSIFLKSNSKWSVKPEDPFQKKILSLRSNYKFGVILGQISKLKQSLQIIYQNEALGISFWKKLIWGSYEVTRGQKSPKQSSFMNLNKITKIFSEVSKIFQSRFVIWCKISFYS